MQSPCRTIVELLHQHFEANTTPSEDGGQRCETPPDQGGRRWRPRASASLGWTLIPFGAVAFLAHDRFPTSRPEDHDLRVD